MKPCISEEKKKRIFKEMKKSIICKKMGATATSNKLSCYSLIASLKYYEMLHFLNVFICIWIHCSSYVLYFTHTKNTVRKPSRNVIIVLHMVLISDFAKCQNIHASRLIIMFCLFMMRMKCCDWECSSFYNEMEMMW